MLRPEQRSDGVLQWTGAIAAALIAVAAIALCIVANSVFNKGISKGALEKTSVSRDGTVIAYEQSGSGPAVILVSAALADRVGARALAERLAGHFTVINYDRRGRGKSADTPPYSVEREVEDIDALIDASGGRAFVFGSFSGAVLALDAASKLGAKVEKVFLYEPPFIVDDSRPPMPGALTSEIVGLLSEGRNRDAVTAFFTTLTAPALVMVGSRSEPFFHSGAKALAGMLSHGEYRALEGRDHSAVLITPAALADAVRQFFY